jgi:uncharacterized protein YndB with AHSA1/START domain
MTGKILLAVAAALIVFALVVATRPAAFSISRSIIIAAPPTLVYKRVADFKAWPAWSPWAKLDPEMKTSYAGPPGQPGATYEWSGNDKVGAGRMTVVQAQPPAMLDLKLEFLKPFHATNASLFNFVPAGSGTLATWSMSGNNSFMAKAFAMFADMDKMIGGDFERGLSQLKADAESEARSLAAGAPAPAPAAPVAK